MSIEYRSARHNSYRDSVFRWGWPVLPFRFVEPVVIIGELLILIWASVLSGVGYHWIFLGGIGSIERFVSVGILVFVNISAISAARGNYKATSLLNLRKQTSHVTLTWIFVCAILLAVAFSVKVTEEFSRGASMTFFVVGWSSVIAWRATAAHFVARALAEGAFAERKIVVLAEENQLASSRMLLELRRCGYRPVRIFKIRQFEMEACGVLSSLRTTLDEVIETSRKEQIELICLLVSWDHRRWIDDILTVLRVLPVPVHLLPDENVARLLSNRLVDIGAAWTAELKRAPLTVSEQAAKRALDVLASGMVVIVLAPLMLIVAVLIKLDSRGPILFTQTRNGFNGRSFRICKFRTMRVLEDGPIIRQARQRDPRVTRLGRWLRRTSIDELPQVFNVFLGDMSLVGPRPHAAAHNTEYEKLVANYAFRYHVKPGITGWAQINGCRGETQTVDLMVRRVELDLSYINNWSIWLDLKILARTPFTILHQPGAY
jgi:Undecaprenyl-phosphate glucose phosphotransferase